MATLKQLIECEIGDFFAGFGGPGEPGTPEEMQSQLLARVMPLLAGIEQEPVACIDRANMDYLESGAGADVWPASEADSDDVLLYAAPQLPQPEVPTFDEWCAATDNKPLSWVKDTMREAYDGCRAAMLQGAEPVSQPYTLPDGYCVMPKKLTAENGAKGALSGEFHVTHRITCQSCGGEGCEDCNEEGGWDGEIPIGWDTIKLIYGAAVESCALPAAPQQEA